MYPSRDFRSLINGDDPSLAIRAIAREPFSELLKHWKCIGRPEHLKSIYDQGIEEAIGRDRYPCHILDLVSDCPEFYLPVAKGLRALWIRFNFHLIFETPEEPYLSIDSKYHTNDFTPDQKIHILVWLKYRMNLPLIIGETEYRVGIFPSKRAEEVLQKIHWLDSALLSSRVLSSRVLSKRDLSKREQS